MKWNTVTNIESPSRKNSIMGTHVTHDGKDLRFLNTNTSNLYLRMGMRSNGVPIPVDFFPMTFGNWLERRQ